MNKKNVYNIKYKKHLNSTDCLKTYAVCTCQQSAPRLFLGILVSSKDWKTIAPRLHPKGWLMIDGCGWCIPRFGEDKPLNMWSYRNQQTKLLPKHTSTHSCLPQNTRQLVATLNRLLSNHSTLKASLNALSCSLETSCSGSGRLKR